MIRPYQEADLPILCEIHLENELPPNCMPDPKDSLVLVKAVVEQNGKPVMATFLRGTSEIYLLVDHRYGTPQERWQWLQELKDYLVQEAWKLGLDQMTAWIPPEIEQSFGKRLLELGFQRSPWQSYTLNVE
jgi:hypothetical protein